jgi:ornithine carbamoyltransferase
MDLASLTDQDRFVSEATADQPVQGQAVASLRAVAPATPGYESLLSLATDRIISLGGVGTPALSTFTVSSRLRQRDMLSEVDLTPDEIHEVLETADRLKDMLHSGQPHNYLAGKTLAMFFEHPSTRTRISLQAGMAQLGGQAIVLNQGDLQISRGETIGDTAQIFSRYVNGIAARVASHDTLLALAEHATVPVYNALSDKYHPMQSLSDMLSLKEQYGSLAGLKLVYVGDGANNMAASLLLAGAALGVDVVVATPAVYQPDPDVVTRAKWLASSAGCTVEVTADPWAAVRDADAIYTDVHVSLNHVDGATRAVTLAPYKVTEELMAAAKPSAVFMHCLPMHRGVEVDASVADGPQSIIFEQAENRLHLQKAVLLQTMC